MSLRKRDDGRRDRRRRNLAVVAASTAVVVGMAGLVYASPLLYRWFCQATGFGGTPRIAAAAPGRAEPAPTADRVITVRFNADVNGALPWRFQPARRSVEVRLGEETLAFYHAANLAGEAVTGTATFNVTPAKAGAYFNKIECFCFTEQTLAPGRQVEMPVSFFIDPDLARDRNLDDLTAITLSYTFFRVPRRGGAQAAALAPEPK